MAIFIAQVYIGCSCKNCRLEYSTWHMCQAGH